MRIDLTHTLHNGITVYPGTLAPEFEQGNTIPKDGFAELTIRMCTHTGTHIDAPSHLLPGAKSLDRFPIDQFTGAATLVDAASESRITLGALERAGERISQAEFVLFRTGWEAKWNTPAYFEAFPTLTPEAAHWLAAFNLKAVGLDAISVDRVEDAHLPNHRILLEREILIIENLASLGRLPGGLFELHCLPLKIENADGAPVRAFASF